MRAPFPIQILIVCLVCVLRLVGGDAEPNPAQKLPAEGVRALSTYEQDVAKYKAEYEKNVERCAAAARQRLQVALERETKLGNLDAAIALREAIAKLNPAKADSATADVPVESIERAVVGSWKTDNGYSIKFAHGGTATWVGPSNTLGGSWSLEKTGNGGRAVRINWANGISYRVTSATPTTLTGAELAGDGSEQRPITGKREDIKLSR